MLASLGTAGLGGAQGAPGQGRGVREWHAGLTAALAQRDFWGVELGLGLRPGAGGGQTRFAVAVAAGDAEGTAGVRVAGSAQFVLRPAARSGASPYAGLGLAFAGARGVSGGGYLAALLGVEAAPGTRRGWFVELGVGGGVRAVAGMRWRRLPS